MTFWAKDVIYQDYNHTGPRRAEERSMLIWFFVEWAAKTWPPVQSTVNIVEVSYKTGLSVVWRTKMFLQDKRKDKGWGIFYFVVQMLKKKHAAITMHCKNIRAVTLRLVARWPLLGLGNPFFKIATSWLVTSNLVKQLKHKIWPKKSRWTWLWFGFVKSCSFFSLLFTHAQLMLKSTLT